MDDSSLKLLKITTKDNKNLNISPPFSKKILEYYLEVGSEVDGVNIQAVPTESDGFAQVQKASANGGIF